MRILVVEDEELKRVTLVEDLLTVGHEAVPASDGESALELLAGDVFDVVVTDIRMPGIDGMELLNRIKENANDPPEVIIMTAYGSIPIAVEAMRTGAFDFITKPFQNDSLFPLLDRIESKKKSASELASILAQRDMGKLEDKIVGGSSAISNVRKMVELCAQTDSTILLTGETGTGKDLVAKAIHKLSHRNSSPFIKVNCAVFSKLLIQSELYGHEKWAFTGAENLKMGKFELAQHGTVYLDDVDDIPLDEQIKVCEKKD